MLIILLLYFLLFPPKIFAAPIVSIIDFPESIIAGNNFNVTFSISTAIPGSIYHYKIVGDGNSEFLTQPNTSCASDYNTCENINIATESANIATASAKLNLISGTYSLKIRIAQSEKHTTTYNSDIVSLISILPTPIPPTPTPIPTNTPNPTPTSSPTSIPTPTLISTPNITPTTKPTPTEIITPTPIIEIPTEIPTDIPISTPTFGTVLGESTSPKKNFIPLIFICLGGIFLLAPLIITKIKSNSNVKKNN